MVLIPEGMTMAQVTPINQHSVRITHRRQLAEVVELPAIAACEHLYDLNIRTIQASASCLDFWKGGRCFIVVDISKMSPANATIARGFCEDIIEVMGVTIGRFTYPMSPEMLVTELSTVFLQIAKMFQLQSLDWASSSLHDLKKIWERDYGPGAGRRLRLKEILEEGFALDTDTWRFYDSEEHLAKEVAFRHGQILTPA